MFTLRDAPFTIHVVCYKQLHTYDSFPRRLYVMFRSTVINNILTSFDSFMTGTWCVPITIKCGKVAIYFRLLSYKILEI